MVGSHPRGKLVGLPYIVLAIEVLLFYRLILFRPARYIIPWDFRYYHLPILEFVAASFRRGELPLWDPYTYCGIPLYADLTAQVFYPPTVIAILLSNAFGGGSLDWWMEWQLVLHVFAGGVFTYWLLRRLGTGTWAALIGATVFQLGAYFASQTQHLGAIDAAAWMPLAWLAVIDLAGGITGRRMAILAFALATSLLAGFPAVSAFVVASTMLLALSYSPRTLLACLAGGILAVALAVVQLAPTYQLTQLSVARFRADFLGNGGGLPLESVYSLVVPNAWRVFQFEGGTWKLPWNPTFLYLYSGLAGLICAVTALWRPTRTTWVFLGMGVLAAGAMFGGHTSIGYWAYRILPVSIRGPVYAEFALPVFCLAFALLAGLGAHRLVRGRTAGILLVTVVALELIVVSSGRPINTADRQREPGVSASHFDGSKELLDGVRELSYQSQPPWRIDTRNASANWSQAPMMLRIPTANGDNPFALERLIQVRLAFAQGHRWGRFYQVEQPASPVLDMLNVRYVLSRQPWDAGLAERSGFQLAATLPGNTVYENTEALPRFWFVPEVRTANGMQEALAILRDSAFDPRKLAVVEGAPKPPAASGTISVRSYGPRSLDLDVDLAAPGFLVTSEAWYPGWRASVDGQEVPLRLTNVAFRGLAIPPGRHRVSMVFAPRIVWWSALVSLLALGGCGWLFLAKRRAPGSAT